MAQHPRFSEWMMLVMNRQREDVFVGGVLCTLSALVMGISPFHGSG
jgi:hypothetical protein